MTKKSKKSLVIEELEKMPNVSFVCSKLGISRQSYYRWKKNDKGFRRKTEVAISRGDAHLCDIAENQLIKKIQSGEWPAVKYMLDKRHPRYHANYFKESDSREEYQESTASERARKNAYQLLRFDEDD